MSLRDPLRKLFAFALNSSSKTKRRPEPLRCAARCAVEALELRRYLAVDPDIAELEYAWTHMSSAFRAGLLEAEQEAPAGAQALAAYLQQYGLVLPTATDSQLSALQPALSTTLSHHRILANPRKPPVHHAAKHGRRPHKPSLKPAARPPRAHRGHKPTPVTVVHADSPATAPAVILQPATAAQPSGSPSNSLQSGWYGFEFTTQSSVVAVGQLGRWIASGTNSANHIVKLVDAATSTDVPGGSVTVNTSGLTAGQYFYKPLSSPVLLQPNHSYYLMSQESSGGDPWYANVGLTNIPAIQVNSSETSIDGTTYTAGTAGASNGPVNFTLMPFNYSVPGTQLTFGFSEPVTPVSPNTWLSAISVIDLKTGDTVTPTSVAVNSTIPGVTFTLGTGVPKNGNYLAVLHGSHIADSSGNNLVGSDGVAGHEYLYQDSSSLGFWYQAADANRDRKVGSADIVALLNNYGATNATYSMADFNGDGEVGSDDTVTLLNNFGATLQAPFAAPGTPTLTAAGTDRLLISWQAPTGSTVTGYDVYRNWQRVGSGVSGTSFLDTGLTAGTSYTYSIVARSASGNTSFATAPLIASTAASAALSVQPINGKVMTEGDTLGVTTTFSDAGPAASHSASINWGDGSTTAATVLPSNNNGTIIAAHQYTMAGTYYPILTVQSSAGGSATTIFSVAVADAPLTATGAAISAVVNSPFNGIVADFSDADLSAAANKYTASINWGDNTAATAGTIVDNGNGDFSVTGSHTYSGAGSLPLTVTIKDIGGSTATATGAADVAPPPASAPTSLSAAAVSNSEIDLSWGADASGNSVGYNIYRSTTPGVLPIAQDMLDFGITSTTYQDTGLSEATTYYYLVTSANSASQESSPSNVASSTTPLATLSASGTTISPTEGEQFDGTVGSFTDTDTNADQGNYTATINWGDGSGTSTGTIQPNSSGGFDVVGNHTYQDDGTKSVTVTIQQTSDGRSQTATSTANVADAMIEAEGTTLSGTQGQAITSTTVATFRDDNAGASVGDFTANINWGDSRSSAGQIQSNGQGSFSVLGTHTYSNSGDESIVVNITDAGGSTASADGTAHVAAQIPAGAVITDGTIKLGVTSFGSLGYDGTGLVLVSSGNGALDPTDESEGWGAADANSGVTGHADLSGGFVSNLTVTSFSYTTSTAVSVVDVGSTLEVTQDYHPAKDGSGNPIPGLYEISVYIANISNAPVDARYRRVMDWDVNGVNDEFVSNHVADPQVIYDNNDEGPASDPLSAKTANDIPTTPINYLKTGSFTNAGPGDQGTLFDLGDFGTLAPHSTQTFKLYYGGTATGSQATSDLSAAGIQSYSLAQLPGQADSDADDGAFPSSTDGDADDSPDNSQNAFVFGFKPGTQLTVDLGVDANNDGTINSVDESIKDNPSLPGKVIVANTLDENASNMPGYADFDTYHALYTMDLTLGSGIDYTKAKIRFRYSAVDPNLVKQINVPGSDISRYDPGSMGALRLWDASAPRSPTSIGVANGHGDFIPDGVAFPASDLIFNGNNLTSILVEGVNPTDPSNTRVVVDIDPDGSGHWVLHDAVRFTVAQVKVVYTDVSGLSHLSNANGN